MLEKEWYLYILRCGDGSLYTGITTDLKKRFRQHCTGKGAQYTKGRGPLEIVFSMICDTHSLALKMEYAVKRLSKGQKEKLLSCEDVKAAICALIQ